MPLVDYLTSGHGLFVVTLPLLASLAAIFWTVRSPKPLWFVGAFFLGVAISAGLSSWGEEGLHIVPAAGLLCLWIVWRFPEVLAVAEVYAYTFLSMLLVDFGYGFLYASTAYPMHPEMAWTGVGGAGVLDALLVQPILMSLTAWLIKLRQRQAPQASVGRSAGRTVAS